MPKFLPVAAAIIGLLCFSAPTLAEDTQTSPSEWHTSWETIQADDIHHYVEQALSDKYYGVYAWGAGRLHRLQEPILFSNAWMECRKFVDENLIIYKKHSGLSIGNKYEYSDFYNNSIVDFFKSDYNGSKDIQLKSTSEIEKIIESKSDSFTIIRNGEITRKFIVFDAPKTKNLYSIYIILSENKNPQLIISGDF